MGDLTFDKLTDAQWSAPTVSWSPLENIVSIVGEREKIRAHGTTAGWIARGRLSNYAHSCGKEQ